MEAAQAMIIMASENADMVGALLFVAVCAIVILVGCLKGW